MAEAPESADDARYFQAVEEHFVQRRGDPLFLSSADWFLVWKWRRAGLPLRIVLRGIGDSLESHALSWSRDRRVSSLAYCRGEVEAAARRWREELGEPADAPRRDARALLERFAEQLAAAPLAGGAEPRARALAEALRERAARARRGPALDRWLAEREQELVEALLQADPALRAEIEVELSASLGGYRSRLPAELVAQVECEARARLTLQRHSLPRLSLFPERDA